MGKEDLLQAVKDGNVQFVRKSLHKHQKSIRKKPGKKTFINQPDSEGFTALHYAALSGDVECVSAILQMDGDPNARDQKGMTPLHLSAWAGKEESLKLLLENRALPNLPAFSGDTPLHLAAQHGYSGCTKILLASHADGCFRNGFLETPLDLAAQYGHTSVVKSLLANEAVQEMITSPVIDTRYKSPLHLSAKSGHDDIVHFLLKAGANVNEERAEGTPLHIAALYGKTEVVKLLLKAGAVVSKQNNNGMIPLDLVNKFTTSRAGLEIKQMLREAAGERIVYAKAICDYNNPSLADSISFKANDMIAVLEQNVDGCWKGYVVNQEHEKVGYFPGMTVQLVVRQNKTQSVSSFGSQASSGDSTGGRSTTSPTSSVGQRSETVSPTKQQPVGIVPVGQFEVVALAQTEPDGHSFPKQTANGGFAPRMSSFKQKSPSQRPQGAQKYIQRAKSTNSEPRSHVILKRTLSAEEKSQVPVPPVNNHVDTTELQKTSYPDNRRQTFSTPTTRARNFSEINSATLSRHAIRNSTEDSSGNYRHRAASAGSSRQEIAQKIHQSIQNRKAQTAQNGNTPSTSNETAEYAQTSSAMNHTVNYNSANSTTCGRTVSSSQEISSYPTTTNTLANYSTKTNYASVHVTSSPTSKQTPYQPTEYTSVYIADQNNAQLNKNLIDNDNNLYENINSSKAKLKPILFSSNRSNSIRSESSVESSVDDRTKANTVSFTNNKPNRANRTNYEAMHSYSFEEENNSFNPPLPLKRSNTGSTSRNSKEGSVSDRQPSMYENVALNEDVEDGKLMRTTGDEVFMLDQKLSMDEQEVVNWLKELKLANYFENFKTHGFDMVSMRAITPEDLNILDITKTGHRKKILSEVAKLPPSTRLPLGKPHDVGSWLGELNLRQYEANFIEGGFDDIDFIKDLDRNDLEMIDIKKKGHQKKILLAVQILNDLELTAILDQAVAESPTKRTSSGVRKRSEIDDFFPPTTPSFTMTSLSYPLSPRDDLPPPSGQEQIIRQTSPNQVPAVAKKPSTSKKPVPVPATKPKPAAKSVLSNPSTGIKPVHNQVNGVANNVGKVSMTPPGVIQGDQEEIVTSSRSRDFFKKQESESRGRTVSSSSASSTSSDNRLRSNTTPVSQPHPGDIQGNQEELVISSKSRDFFKKQELSLNNEVNIDSRISPRQRSVSNSSASSTSSETRTCLPVTSPDPKPKPFTSTQSVEPIPEASRNTIKKTPPPAPPRKSSVVKQEAAPPPSSPKSEAVPQLEDFLPPPPLMSPPPLDEDVTLSQVAPPPPEIDALQAEIDALEKANAEMALQSSMVLSKDNELQTEIDAFDRANAQITISETTPKTEDNDDIQAEIDALEKANAQITCSPQPNEGHENKKSENEVKQVLGETDDILADIMADIDDFSAQLDNMF